MEMQEILSKPKKKKKVREPCLLFFLPGILQLAKPFLWKAGSPISTLHTASTHPCTIPYMGTIRDTCFGFRLA